MSMIRDEHGKVSSTRIALCYGMILITACFAADVFAVLPVEADVMADYRAIAKLLMGMTLGATAARSTAKNWTGNGNA